jgi:hypothetical protein
MNHEEGPIIMDQQLRVGKMVGQSHSAPASSSIVARDVAAEVPRRRALAPKLRLRRQLPSWPHRGCGSEQTRFGLDAAWTEIHRRRVIRSFLVSLAALLRALAEPLAAPPDQFASDSDFLEFIQRKAFDYFWLETNPANGLIRDRSRTNSYCSIAAVGFGLTAIGIGIDHGWITREQGRERVLRTVRTFHEKPQGPDAVGNIGYRGWFYHFLDMDTGLRAWKCELSSIDTALFLAGALYAREYFSGAHADEAAIRDLVDRIYNRIDWHWMTGGASGEPTRRPTPNPSQEGNKDSRPELQALGAAASGALTMGWRPESGFIQSRWIGYNEAMILLLLGLGANDNPDTEAQRAAGILPAGEGKDLPTGRRQNIWAGRALPPEFWKEWTRGYQWKTSFGQSFVHFPPLFGHQYSHCWIDFHGLADDYMRDRGIDYFENSRRATLAQNAYCVANPGNFKGYGERVWGLTACDGPGFGEYRGYSARGAPPPENDDGTIAPTAAGGSLPFAPEICIPTLRHFYDQFRPGIWTRYGFCDAFNRTAGWWDSEVLGIDQGPILIMIENNHTGRVWRTFMKAVEIQRGLKNAGFRKVEH